MNIVLNLSNKCSIILLLSILFSACQGAESNHKDSTNTGIECGGGIGYTCPVNYFCNLSPDCGGIDRKGYCKRIPDDCDLTENEVCGCDGKEYKNECIANTLSVTVKTDGECIQAPSFIE